MILVNQGGLTGYKNTADSLYDINQIISLGINNWVNIIDGTVTELNRDGHFLSLSDGSKINYDSLILTTGLENSLSNRINHHDVNVISVGHKFSGQDVILTGFNFDAFNKLNYMIEQPFENQPNSIILIENSQRDPNLPDSVIEFTLSQAESKFDNLKIYREVEIQSVETQHEVSVKSVSLSNGEILELNSNSIILGFCGNRINPSTFRMYNDACLVVDSRLVIDKKFRTNDPNIYAAGTCTKYARHYLAEADQNTYNSKLIGASLSKVFMKSAANKISINKLDPNGDLQKLPDLEAARLENFDHQPVVNYGNFSGNLEVFTVSHTDLKNMRSKVISSGNLAEQGRFMKIDLDINGNVVGIVACRSDGVKICRNNLIRLFNLHEKVIHNLKFRQDLEKIDLFDFLKIPCLKAVYHDRFEDLLTCSSDLIKNSEIKSIVENLVNDMTLNEQTRNEVFDTYKASDLKVKVEEMVDSFLRYNSNHLPMFARPGSI